MKKLVLSAVALVAFGTASAQEVKFGAKAGLNLSTIKTTAPEVEGAVVVNPDNKMAVGFHVGGFAEIEISDKFSFQPELLFSMQGSKLETNESETENFGGSTFSYTIKSEENIKTSYINLPLLGKYKATEKLFFVAGPQFGFLMSAKDDYTSTTTTTFEGVTETETESKESDVKKSFKGLNIALGLGGGYFFTDNLFAEARYNIGLSNDAKEVSETVEGVTYTVKPEFKSSSLQISLGYKF